MNAVGIDEIRAEVERLTLGPDDYVIVRVQQPRIRSREAEALIEALGNAFSAAERSRVIVLAGDLELTSVPREELERILAESRAAQPEAVSPDGRAEASVG